MRWVVLAVVALLFSPTGALAQGSSNVSGRGEELATRLCAECHAVEPGAMVSPREGVASFQAIADTPGMTALALEVWLTTPHREMPHLLLDTGERQDLITYMTSLKRKTDH
ncbi:MAG: cytochrome C [Hyphomicrobiaceae bacterium]